MMQTFLPYSSFNQSIQCLDNKRLGKQRVEARQIYDTITLNLAAWSNHPCIKMWRPYPCALALYHNLAIQEWIKRRFYNRMPLIIIQFPFSYPKWLGDIRLHSSHRAALIAKDEHYDQFQWNENPQIRYYWPA